MKQTVKTSRATGQLEKMFRELNKHYFAGKLPEPIISLKKTPSAYGHITCSKVWQAGGENKYGKPAEEHRTFNRFCCWLVTFRYRWIIWSRVVVLKK